MNKLTLTNDKELEKDPHFHKIAEMIDMMVQNGTAYNFSGNCIAAADIIQHLLSGVGISSRILECKVSVIKDNPDQSKSYLFVGYDNNSYKGQVDTHVVVVTESSNPILIDMSLIYALPQDHPFVVEKASLSTNGDKIGEYKIGDVTMTYLEKQKLKLANIHQKNLLQRLVNEQLVERSLKSLKAFVIVAVTLGLINFTLNIILIFIRLYDIKWI